MTDDSFQRCLNANQEEEELLMIRNLTMDKEKLEELLYDAQQGIPIHVVLKDVIDLIDKDSLIIRCKLRASEEKIQKLENELKDIPDEWSHELMQAEIDSLESSRSEFEHTVAKEYYQKYKDSSFSETLREELRQQYQKRFNDEEKWFADRMGLVQRREANNINELELLKADIRRLEKLCKNLAEENMMLQNPPIDGSTFEFKDVRGIVHKATMSRLYELDQDSACAISSFCRWPEIKRDKDES